VTFTHILGTKILGFWFSGDVSVCFMGVWQNLSLQLREDGFTYLYNGAKKHRSFHFSF
jgi:predicted membrane protein